MRQRFGCSAKGILFVWPYPFWSYYVCFLLQMQLASFIETCVFETIEHVGNYVFNSAWTLKLGADVIRYLGVTISFTHIYISYVVYSDLLRCLCVLQRLFLLIFTYTMGCCLSHFWPQSSRKKKVKWTNGGDKTENTKYSKTHFCVLKDI